MTKLLTCYFRVFPCISMYFLWWCHLSVISYVEGASPSRVTALTTQELTEKYYTTTRPLYITTNKKYYTHLGPWHIFTVNQTLGRDSRISHLHLGEIAIKFHFFLFSVSLRVTSWCVTAHCAGCSCWSMISASPSHRRVAWRTPGGKSHSPRSTSTNAVSHFKYIYSTDTHVSSR